MSFNNLNFDFIIIGAGAAGCVLANRLSADENNQVLLIDAGDNDTHLNIKDVAGFVKLWNTELDWAISSEKQSYLNDRIITLNQGKVLGGSTSLNAMMYVRGNKSNFDDWENKGNVGWGYDNVLPLFIGLENYENGSTDYRGNKGEISVRDCPDNSMISPHFLNAAVELGYQGPNWDYNGAVQENGSGLLQFHINRDGSRCSSSSAFLDPIKRRKNLQILTKCLVRKLIINNGITEGIEFQSEGEVFKAFVRKEVILSAGALGSPKILLNSGIGPQSDLNDLDISVHAHLPGVGKNLQDHLQLPIIYRSKIDSEHTQLLTGNVLFVNLVNEKGLVDLQLNFTPSLPKPLEPILPNLGGPICIFLPILVNPESRGEVTLNSSNPEDIIKLNPNYLTAENDLKVLQKGIDLVRKLANSKSFESLNGGEIMPGLGNENLEAFIRNNCSTLWHPVGTCKMGVDEMAVVDPTLKVKGISKLRVADASIMPTIISGNTVATCFMIGEKASQMILSDKNNTNN